MSQQSVALDSEEKLSKQYKNDRWAMDAIEAGDFQAYHISIMHDWLKTLTLLASMLIPLFFVLDILMMPSNLLPRFAIYRGTSTLLVLLQLIIVRNTRPSKLSYIHGYFFSMHVGGMIALMTVDLGGFTSSYYAGLNLVIIAVNLIMPWRPKHTFFNAGIIIGMYVGLNLIYNPIDDYSPMINNLFFMGATTILSMGINHVRFRLMNKEFTLLIDIEKARDDLSGEKEIVEEKTKSLKSLLDVSGQGFLSFDSDFIISPEYSNECRNIFGTHIESLRVDELLYDDPEKRNEFKMGLELYFEGQTKAQVIFDHLDKVFYIGDKIVNAEYKKVDAKRVMLILTDVTEETRILEESKREREKWQMIRKVISNKQAFGMFDREAKKLFGALVTKEKNFDELMPDLHTVKGNAGFMGFTSTQDAAHALEDVISQQKVLGDEIFPAEEMDNLTNAFADEIGIVINTLGPSWRLDVDLVELPKAEFQLIEDHIKTHAPTPKIMRMLDEHRKKPVADMVARFPEMAQQVAERMAKRVYPVKIIGTNIHVIYDDFEELIDAFSHIVRNLVTHGIELPVEREHMGKPLAGTIGIEVEEDGENIIFNFSDDGRGIHFEAIEQKARELGYLSDNNKPSRQQLLSFLFKDDFSTSSNVSLLAGRGVGLSAVRTAVKKMGGRINVKTWENHGTIFTITVPRQT